MRAVPSTPGAARRRRPAALIAAGLTLAFAAGGCDLQEDADTDRGRELFQTNCGTCHALAEAGTSAEVGPDLDSSFAAARSSGMDQDTIEGVVERQIAHPYGPEEGEPDYDEIYMPADIVTGRDAEAVAAYVASVAGVVGIKPPPLGTAMDVFLEKCGSCHALEAAGSAGTTGPDLDEVLSGQDPAQVAESIRDPNAEISPGFEAGIMPPFDEGQIPDPNLNALVAYLLACSGDADNPDCEEASAQEESAGPETGGRKATASSD
jgi:mono/diheme cytochrome c family protein